MKLSTVSGAITRLVAAKLVEHTPYGTITLTPEGEQYALIMVRRHRLLETFLVKSLGYTWDEVHTEADSLEHAVSDTMIDRIEASLGHPTHDPHGDPIPTKDGTIEEEATQSLAEVAANAPSGTVVTVERISDEDPELLRYLASEHVGIGTRLRIGQKAPYSNSVSVTVVPNGDASGITLGNAAAEYIRVVATEAVTDPRGPETVD
ncbi:MAG: metal-dependent transcriptional regulator [Bifidobacteriaceae bacterium]|jgi:DtxR family Mn-dependent transcriptional regulator|nr:metal-dependent transcriptional regulator [Bifidobacteriaceae bacterium]